MHRASKGVILFILMLLLPAPLLLVAGTSGRTTDNLCRGCHGGRFGAYVTLSQLSIPEKVVSGETFNVSVRMDVSGNLDEDVSEYWLVHADATLESQQGRVLISQPTISHEDMLPGDFATLTWLVDAGQSIGTDVLQMRLSSIADHEERTGFDIISGHIEIVAPNKPPQLSNPSIEPLEGNANELFWFRTTWSDADGESPISLEVVIDGQQYPMNPLNTTPDPETTKQGRVYISQGIILEPGLHSHYYQGDDGEASVRIPAIDQVVANSSENMTGQYPGPYVGAAPVLLEANLSAMDGDNRTEFIYSVLLAKGSDTNGTQVALWLDGTETMIIPEFGKEGDEGIQVQFRTTLSAGINHFHHFVASNRFGNARLPEGSGSLDGPVIVSGVVSNATIEPTSGDQHTPFTFTMNYANPLNIPPDEVIVVIDGTNHYLSVSDNRTNWTENQLFSTTTTLDPGVHTYYFLTQENEREHRIPVEGSMYLLVTRFDSEPWFSDVKILVEEEILFDENNIITSVNQGSESPPLILQGTPIELKLTFNDDEGDSASEGSVLAWIDGMAQPMQRNDSHTPLDGQIWTLIITSLRVGTGHSVWFTATSSFDSQDSNNRTTIRWPADEEWVLPLPAVRPENILPIIRPPPDDLPILEPFTGSPGEEFNFSIEVIDLDWKKEGNISAWLEIDGVNHSLEPMNLVDHRNGTIFSISLVLPAGEHTYMFWVHDDEDVVAYPDAGILSGPVVQANLVRVGSARLPFVQSALWFVWIDVLLIIGGIGWSIQTFREARRQVHARTLQKMGQEMDRLERGKEDVSAIDSGTLFEPVRAEPIRSYPTRDPAYQNLLTDLIDEPVPKITKRDIFTETLSSEPHVGNSQLPLARNLGPCDDGEQR